VVPFEGLKMATKRSEAGKSEDDYVIPLSRQAVVLLRELHKITGDDEFLFPGRGEGRTISENTLNYVLHLRDFRSRTIFEFFNTIRQNRPFPRSQLLTHMRHGSPIFRCWPKPTRWLILGPGEGNETKLWSSRWTE
jgi:integrase